MTATPSTTYANSGGFLPPALPSPAPSTASSRAAAGLPHPRSKPLVPGSRKEDYAREYVYRRLLHISRRYVKKHSIPDPSDLVSAYSTFDEVCKDLEEVVDVLWFSGTPSLQVPYLLNVALAITEYLPAFPPSPRPTFALLKKLDHCFASLLQGRDIRTRETLPGFENGMAKGMTRTDMVRLRSLADAMRSLVAIKMSDEADVDTSLFPEDSEAPPASVRPQSGEEDETNDEASRTGRSGPSRKRQRTESPAGVEIESPAVKREHNSLSPATGSPFPAAGETAAAHNGQFHFALEEDSDDERDGQDGQDEQIMRDVTDAQQITPRTTSPGPNEQQLLHMGNLADYLEVDDEDEELHMSVAKVYEKTIIQLGKTLGETLIDE